MSHAVRIWRARVSWLNLVAARRLTEVKGMADRINGMRAELKTLLVDDLGSKQNWDHISE